MRNSPTVINAHLLSQPMVYGLELQRDSNGYWRVARPISAPTLWERFVIAWRVFIGQYDALEWTPVEK